MLAATWTAKGTSLEKRGGPNSPWSPMKAPGSATSLGTFAVAMAALSSILSSDLGVTGSRPLDVYHRRLGQLTEIYQVVILLCPFQILRDFILQAVQVPRHDFVQVLCLLQGLIYAGKAVSQPRDFLAILPL